MLAAHGVNDSGDLSGTVGLPGHCGNSPVGANLACGDSFDDLDYLSCKEFHYTPKFRYNPSKSWASISKLEINGLLTVQAGTPVKIVKMVGRATSLSQRQGIFNRAGNVGLCPRHRVKERSAPGHVGGNGGREGTSSAMGMGRVDPGTFEQSEILPVI